MTVTTVDTSVTPQCLATALIKRFDLFHFLRLSAGLANVKVLASKICLS